MTEIFDPVPVTAYGPHDIDDLTAAEQARHNGHGKPMANGKAPKPHRVPPHNLAAEESLLGAMLLSAQAIEAAADVVGPDDFYKPAHGHIYAAITTLHGAGQPVDTVTVHDQLGALATPETPSTLTSMLANTPVSSNAGRYARIVAEHATLRRLIRTAGDIVDRAYELPEDPAQVIDACLEALEQLGGTGTDDDSTWSAVDLTAILSGEHEPTEPSVGHLEDGQALFYLGRINAINAESESGKTWLALVACTQEIAAGHNVTYLDFEDDAPGVTGRLLDLGADPDDVAAHLTYLRPDDAFDTAAAGRLRRHLADTTPTLVVLDGVTEILAQNAWKVNDNDDVAAFAHRVLRPIARAGAAVVLIDHVTKDKEAQGSHAIGAQHKRAMISGASYKLEVIEPFGRGRTGRARIIITKDRPGAVRGQAVGGRNIGTIQLGSPVSGHVTALLRHFTDDPEQTFRPTALMEKVSRAVEDLNGAGEEPTQAAIIRDVGGKKTHVVAAIRTLVDEHHLTTVDGPKRSTLHVLARPYHQRDDPLSDRYEPPPDPDQEHPHDSDF